MNGNLIIDERGRRTVRAIVELYLSGRQSAGRPCRSCGRWIRFEWRDGRWVAVNEDGSPHVDERR